MNFEIPKTLWRINFLKAKRIGLQVPEGLCKYILIIADILKEFSNFVKEIIILADVCYGACCIEDIIAKDLNLDLLVHYGHSALVPDLEIPTLYVLVDIEFNPFNLISIIKSNFNPLQSTLYMFSTVQFISTLQKAVNILTNEENNYKIKIPHTPPLSLGEIIGCTSMPIIDEEDEEEDKIGIFISDGRFHIEALMISNPSIITYRFDPYKSILTREFFDNENFFLKRNKVIEYSRNCNKFGIIFGTLGRQGDKNLLYRILKIIPNAYVVLVSEITPELLNSGNVDIWVQLSCPRLSTDWGDNFCNVPILNPFEIFAAFKGIKGYYLDHYALNGGPWSNSRSLNYIESEKNIF